MIDNKGIKTTDKHVFFWGGWPSNWYKSPFVMRVNGKKEQFSTTEQYFMFKKAQLFKDEKTAKDILATKNPRDAKLLGRRVSNYDDKKWSEVRYNVMLEANLQKYLQNKELRKELLDKKYDGKTFVEASPYDKIWGIGMHMDEPSIDDENIWLGENLLGKIINEVRASLLLKGL